ncbi:hypothetical protein J4E86_007573 [Alternaria arbusti]|uniref:uncharacterized protein n=1 Tax=Alternaria arbusti TaxID=232088 RepID=UPI00221FD527|nr:uncharacterized protein J4E86_007573 [Alternaria arbusti]KAI4951064.1 hypothetical protein J4E86_007573 [Alternaria arbusti]
MAERPAKSGSSRKRALVSCDRCKIRRARCIRENAEVPCADCKANGVVCESKLPRKQRVYGSVETLSLRYRALESLVKGLFPDENVQDTETLFKIATTRNIAMPASDDFTPADIFSSSSSDRQTSSLEQQQQQQHSLQPSPVAQSAYLGSHTTTYPLHSARRTTALSTSKERLRQPITQQVSSQTDEIVRTNRGASHYFGPSSSFRLASTIRTLASRWKAVSGADFPGLRSFTSNPSSRSGSALKRSSTNPSEDEFAPPSYSQRPGSSHGSRKRSRTEWEASNDPSQHHDHSSRLDTIGDLIPAKHIADALVAVYFDHIHVYFPLFNRTTFQIRLEATYSRKTQLFEECKDMGWLVSLALVLSFGCQKSKANDVDQMNVLRHKFLAFAKTYFRTLLTSTRLDNVQALVLLNMHHHNIGQKSSSWLLIGLAARMAITMGMHRDSTNVQFEPIECNTRRQVWWSLYIFEKTLCGILGRPTVIDDREMSMKVPNAPMLEQTRINAAFMNLCSDLVSTSYRIRQRAYFDKTSAEERSPTIAVAMALLRECDNFFAKIPQHMSIEDMPGHPDLKAMTLLLHVYYYYTRCVISRDFLIQKVESNVCFLENKAPPISEDWSTTLILAEDCVESVHKSLQCITIGIELGIFEIIGYSWLDFFFVFHAVLIVCADFLARPKGQTDSPRDVERKATVRTVLDQVRGMQKLAPTYKTLGRIALQFATITGVTQDNDSPTVPDVPEEGPLDSVVDMAAEERTDNADILDIGNDWYTDATADLGLDFFDLSQATHPGSFPIMDPPSRSENTGDQTGDVVDDWTDRALKGMHTL